MGDKQEHLLKREGPGTWPVWHIWGCRDWESPSLSSGDDSWALKTPQSHGFGKGSARSSLSLVLKERCADNECPQKLPVD